MILVNELQHSSKKNGVPLMCGICGIVDCNKNIKIDPGLVLTGSRALRHRGPDFQDVWNGGNCVLGHARLSVIDLTEAGNQPMLDPLTGNVLVFNGEIYNYHSLRKELQESGEEFFSKGDSEVLLALYRRYGSDMVGRLRGMFAFAIWDKSSQKLFVARDRVGKKPFFYKQQGNRLFFSSELESLRLMAGKDSGLNLTALDCFLSLTYVPGKQTIWKDIFRIGPGECGFFSQTGLNLRKYHENSFAEKVELDDGQAIEEFHSRLRDAVRVRLKSDVPLGVLLSGGVDSSLIAAIMADLSPDRVKAFTMGFADEKYDELPQAIRTARSLGLEHEFLVADRPGTDLLSTVAVRYGEPYADNSALPSFMLCKMTRSAVTVAVNGDGGDELMGGYGHYARGLFASLLESAGVRSPVLPGRDLECFLNGCGVAGSLGRSWIYRHRFPELKPLYRREYFQGADKESLYTPEMKNLLGLDVWDWRQSVISASFDAASKTIDRLLWIDNNTYLPGDLLPKMDIASMSYGLEIRSPFLDQELVQFANRLEPGFKVRNGKRKFLLKKVARLYLDPEVMKRPKKGFSIPVSDWMRTDLADFTRDVLDQARPGLEPLLNWAEVERILSAHIDRKEENGSRLWILLCLGLWQISCN